MALQASGPNAEQIRFWNEISGARWVALQQQIDAQIEGIGLDTLDRAALRADERVLDVGCGCGTTTLEIAARVGAAGSVLGVDISEQMLEVARRRAASSTIRFENADAQTYAFEPKSFDAVFSRFGVMFFADPPAAFANLLRALRTGGRLAFACWQGLDRNPWAAVPLGVVARYVQLPPPLPPGSPGPFAFADPERVRGILGKAGFADIALEPREGQVSIGGTADLDAAVSFLTQLGPAGALLREAGESTRQKAETELREVLRPHAGDGGVRMNSATWIVTAKRPA